MPTSKNRRQIEIPVEVYERLRHEASRRGVSVIAVTTDLLVRGLGGMELPATDTRLREPAKYTSWRV